MNKRRLFKYFQKNIDLDFQQYYDIIEQFSTDFYFEIIEKYISWEIKGA